MKLKIFLYGFLFMSLALSCTKTVIEPLKSTHNKLQTTNLKSATIGTYFISPNGSNKNPGTESQPFLTAAYAASKTKPGDIVIFEDGIYTGTPENFFASLSRSGTSSDYITFKARNKWGAVLDGRNNTSLGGFSISGSYINIEGFELKGFSEFGFEVRAGASHVNIRDVYVHDIGRKCTNTGDGLDAFYISGCSYITIERCLIHDIGRFGPGENGCTPGNSNYRNHDHGLYIVGSSYLMIRNNIIYNINKGFALHIFSSKGLTSSYVNFINNTCYNGNQYQRAGHIILWGSCNNLLIANNIFKDQFSSAIDIYQGSYSYSNVIITKNITSGGNGLISSGSANGITVSNNYNSTDPLFTNEETYDFSLKSNSPATITGYNTGLTTDFLNNNRTTTNIGAYGSLSSAQATTPVTTTTTPATTTNIYYNNQMSAAATKNNCGTGYTGSSVIYVVAANKYSSTISKDDANYKATADLNANKQSYANANGTCTTGKTTVYYNVEITRTATKNDCGPGYVGSTINYVVSANEYSSTISQEDADNQAIAYVNAQKQRNANEHGYCRPIRN